LHERYLSYFAIKNIESETVTPETTMRSQTVEESGAKNANRSTDFLGDLTYKILMPVKWRTQSMRNIFKARTMKDDLITL
jgi:hypothetical protein